METIGKITLGLWIGIMLSALLTRTFEDHTVMYKHGQIDAMTGKIKFELKTNPDRTTEWVEKETK